jgi:hypothetical protein
MAWFYHSLFTLMCNHNMVDLNNVWHMSSLHMVFLPLIQANVDRHISAWNNHRVRKISENGRDIPSHVPEAAFRAYERQRGWLSTPIVVEEDNVHYAAFATFPALPISRNGQAVEDNEVPGLPLAPLDLSEATLPRAINAIRDRAYEVESTISVWRREVRVPPWAHCRVRGSSAMATPCTA